MKRCFLVFSDPGNGFHGVHHTIDGATHNAAGLGAATMPNGRPITVADVRDAMEHQAIISLICAPDEELKQIRIEQHVILV